jgi:tricorn protease
MVFEHFRLIDSDERPIMRRAVLSVVALSFVIIAVSATSILPDVPGEPARLMRRPAISDGRIVFRYQNDLWLVPEEGGIARRLTIHSGVEDYPKFSPDGRWIAFQGDYNERSGAIFVMPADGGSPAQLTFHSLGGQPITWTNDGKKVLFASRRESFVRFFTKLFSVPAEGGIPVELELGMASFASYSPDGGKIAFNRHPDLFWWWKRYKGTMNQDIWIYDFKAEAFTKITDYEGNDSWPMWTGNTIYFVSDREGDINNIFVHDLSSGETRQVTSFTENGVTWPSMSSDGSRIVFERDARLYVLDTGSGEAKEVVVYTPSDNLQNMTSYIDPLEYIRSFDVSPSAKRIVFEARGEIFTAPAEHGDVRNLTKSPGSRDSEPSWSPDGRYIAYISDRTGDNEIYLVDQMGKEKEKKLTSTGHFKKHLIWSPESDKLAYTTEDNALYIIGIDGSKPKLVARNEHREIITKHWSPDGRWLAYDFAVRNRNRDIFIYDIKEDEHHQVTRELADDCEPFFTPDGKYLILITDRMGGNRMLARISLLPEEEMPFIFEDDEEGVDGEDEDDDEEDDADDDGDDDKKGEKGKKKKKKEKVEVKIDFKDIESRIRRIPRTGGRALHNVQATERYYYYQIAGRVMFFMRPSYDLYAFDVEKLKTKKMASSIVTYAIAADGKKLAYYDGTTFGIVKVGQKVAAKKKDDDDDDKKNGGKLNIKKKTRMKLDRRAEWNQIFDEGWRVVKYHFYDPNYHGVDWDAVKKRYESLLPYVRTRDELNLLMTEMVGELNASHQGVRGGDSESPPRTTMAFLGGKLVLDEKSGYARFEKIYEANNMSFTYRSPLDNDFIDVKEGDYLVGVDGHILEPNENFYEYLVDKTHNKITILTNDKPTAKGAKETTFKPLNYDIRLQYKDWVDGNVSYVEKESNERIGYMHLSDMMGRGWIEFKEKFERFRYKDAIIIDVRFNGGGNIDTRIIDYLERRPYQISRVRNQSAIERPHDGFYGHVVVLINEFSFSDAEVFPSAVKERGLGTLIGIPTLGYVIAVNSHYLIDGGSIRKTFIGLWEWSTGRNLESLGVEPDILVVSTPELEKAGRDVQLEKAVEFLMDKIGDDPRDYDYKTPIEER